MGSNMFYISAYHPQTNGQTEVVNRSLRNMLRSLSGNKPGQWDLVLTQAKFAYNDPVNRYVGKSPFQIVYGISPIGIVDLVNLSNLEDRRSDEASELTKEIQKLQGHIRQNLQ